MQDLERYMYEALRLTEQATHRVSPNPLVGAVVVSNGEVIGRGVTSKPGHAHAEVSALREAGERAKGADLFVTLEPCCHFGRTPPCTEAILRAGIARVFVGMLDPNPRVLGKGVERLKNAGVHVETGVCETECKRSHASFECYIKNARPYVTLKAAVTLDGRIACANGHSRFVTGSEARLDVHRLRAKNDGILVGAQTLLFDDPQLDVRDVPGESPRPVILDSSLRMPLTARCLAGNPLIFCAEDAAKDRALALTDVGAEIVPVPFEVAADCKKLNLSAVLSELGKRDMVKLLVEGGGAVHGSFLQSRLADELCLYVAPKAIGRGRPVFDLASVDSMDRAWCLSEVEWATFGMDARVTGRVVYPESSCLRD